ncbi:putative ribonuclease H-like domain-containing protein [Tanacetum coccineum]
MMWFLHLLLEYGAIQALFLAFASYKGFLVYQMDVKSAFLYGTIEEEVYVHQPPGFVDPAHPNKVYKVVKALYGLHQAPRAWYETLSSFLLENGFRRGPDSCLLSVPVQGFKSLQKLPIYMLCILTGNQQLVDVNFLVEDSYLGSAKSKQLWQILLLREYVAVCSLLVGQWSAWILKSVVTFEGRISMDLRMDRSNPGKYNSSMVNYGSLQVNSSSLLVIRWT